MTDYAHLENSMKRMMFSAKHLSELAVQHLSKNPPNEAKAALLVNQASSYAAAAYAIYHSHYDRLEHSDIDDVFKTFFAFADELLQNVSESHNHQWSSLEFEKFTKAFEHSCLASPIEE